MRGKPVLCVADMNYEFLYCFTRAVRALCVLKAIYACWIAGYAFL